MAEFSVVLVGAGRVARLWLPHLTARSDLRVVGLVEADEKAGNHALERWGMSCPVFTDLDVALEQTNANLVVNLTPPEFHREVVGRALELGRNVVGETPMTATLAEAYELIAIAEATGMSYSVMQNRRYVTGSRTLRDGVAEGRLGSLDFVSADYFMAPYFDGFR